MIFDEELIPMATLADLAEPLWQRFRPARIQEPTEAMLRKLGSARRGRTHHSGAQRGAVRPVA